MTTVRALLLSALLLAPTAARAAQDLPALPDPWSYRYKPCTDAEVATLVGKPREAALAEVKQMNLKTHRVLAPESPVLTAPHPDRLTLVIAANGTVLRAFCR